MALSGIQTALRTGACDVFVDGLDVGTTDPNGDMAVYTAAFAVLLVTLQFSAPAFGAAANGVATASAITSGTAGNSGTAAAVRNRDRDNATCWDMTAAAGSGDYNMNSASITTSDIVACTSYTFTVPAS